MSPSYIGSIWLFGGNFAIEGFAQCSGQLIAISENTTLYTLLGTTFGGDGVNTFGLPDLRGRVPVGQGTSNYGQTFLMGQPAGTETVTLTSSQMPPHNHLINAATTNASTGTPTNSLFFAGAMNGTATETEYTGTAGAAIMANNMIGFTSPALPFEIIQPTLTATYIIALYGIYPTQN